MRRFLVTATPPTTNGDLHVGHLGGPYLAADVFTRAQPLLGHSAHYVCGGDAHQSYVVTGAERLGVDPAGLAQQSGARIRETLALADAAPDGFGMPDPDYDASVLRFFRRLYDTGRLQRRTYVLPYSPREGRFLLEAFARGHCPECYAESSGAICESCGHPIDPESLLLAGANGSRAGAGAGEQLEHREVELMVLPLEAYRERLEDFYARRSAGMRPHVLRLLQEMLGRALPDWPVTYPLSWGIPAIFGGLEGQVINVWAEMLPALIHIAGGEAWTRGSEYELVQFLGYDNTFYFALAHLGLSFAHGGLLEPTAIITNEFLNLDAAKFSTSRGHLIWARELLERGGVENVRFHLALEHPEHQQSNFTEAGFRESVRTRLHAPLEAIVAALAPHTGRHVSLATRDRTRFEGFGGRMLRAYTLESFSLREAAGTLANLLALLARLVSGREGERVDDRDLALAVHGLGQVSTYAAPLLPSLARELGERLGRNAPPGRSRVPELELKNLIHRI